MTNPIAKFDRRRIPARPDLAAEHLRGQLEASRFTQGRPARIREEVVGLRAAPSPECAQDTQALHGEAVTVYDEDTEGWAWVQLKSDSYVGYLPIAALRPDDPDTTHRVRVPRTFIYPGPNMKLPDIGAVPMGGEVAVVREIDGFSELAGFGYMISAHLVPLGAREPDFVAVAEMFLNAPYLWGGKHHGGIDCSGLVQVSLAAAGIFSPRDTDMMFAELGAPVDVAFDAPIAEMNLRRGDLILWKGHIGIMQSATQLLHANGHHMLVASEPLDVARARILSKSYGPITGIRRVI